MSFSPFVSPSPPAVDIDSGASALSRRRWIGHVLSAAVALCMSRPIASYAAAWPARPVRWVVGYPPGGGPDGVTRLMAQALSTRFAQPVMVDNRAGAAGIIASEAVARATPDGLTWLTADNGMMVFNAALYRRLPYRVDDFAPVGMMARSPLMLVVDPRSGFTDVQQLVRRVRAEPGRYSYASSGAGSPHHLAIELFKQRSSLFIVHVPYRGSQAALQDVASGQVAMTATTVAAGGPLVRSGRLRALAMMSAHRSALMPELPTLHELGVPGVDVGTWHALFVPRATDASIVAQLSGALEQSLQAPAMQAMLVNAGFEAAYFDAPSLAALIAREIDLWHPLIRERHLGID